MNSSMPADICQADFAFGPGIQNCNRSFDFSVTFEESILSIVPSLFLILLAPVRLFSLRGQRKRIGGREFQLLKLISIAVFATIQVVLLAFWCLESTLKTHVSIASAALALVDSLAICILSYAEHTRAIRPSILLGTYLFFSLLFDAVRVRTLWLSNYNATIRNLFTASLAIKGVLLFLEAKEKRKYMNNDDRQRSPEETSSIFSLSVFWWLNGLIQRGFRTVLFVEDLYPIDEGMSSKVLGARFSRAWKANSDQSKYKLAKLSLGLLKWQLLAPVLPRIALIALTFCQPLLINRFLKFLQTPTDSLNVGYALIGAYGIVYFGLALATGFYWHRVFRFITVVRGTYVSAIYHKTTAISITELDNSAAVTLMSTDIERIDLGLRNAHEIWANTIQVALSTYLLQRELGVACIPPLAVAIGSSFITSWISSFSGSRQKTWVDAIQERVGITSAMIPSMKGVKMSGLTTILSPLIQNLRASELLAGVAFRMVQVYTVFIAVFPGQFSPVITFGVFIGIEKAQGRTLETTRMFTSLSLLLLLNSPLMMLFQSIPQFVAALACVGRIQTFLDTPSRADHRLLTVSPRQPDKTHGGPFADRGSNDIELVDRNLAPTKANSDSSGTMISIRDGSFGWVKEDAPILRDINLEITRSQLTIIVGPVASGKTTLLKALLGETPSSKGFVRISTLDFSFCDQTPWLLSQSIQKNIIGFANFESGWYNTVVHACTLDEDISMMPNGDQTMIGSNGITLSGGQKQRLAIARAVYARKEIAIFDDVFSGLDATTEKRVFERLFSSRGLLRKLQTTVILATHAVKFLPSADHIIVLGSEGTTVEQGSFTQLNASDGYVSKLALKEEEVEPATIEKDVETEVKSKSGATTTTTSTSLSDAGSTSNRQTGDLSIYKYYLKSGGKLNSAIFMVMCLGFSLLQSFPDVWVKWWSDAASTSDPKTGMYLGVYAALKMSCLVFLFLLSKQCFCVMTLAAGKKLHQTTLTTVIHAPMLFFSTTDTGVTVNRFSQDMSLVDIELPNALVNFITALFTSLASSVVIALASPYIAIAYPVILTIFYLVQKYYLRTSRQLRFMDIESKAPLYTQFLESLSGLATIRAFGWQEANHALNATLLDKSQRPFYLLFMVQRWLTLVMDLIGLMLVLIVVGIAVKTRESVSPGFAGVSLLNLVSFTERLKWLIMNWTMLETSIGAVSRVKSFAAETPSEDLAGEDGTPPVNWPSQGLIEIENLSAGYKAGKDTLHDVNLKIRPGEKIGIVGRSGSGKSSTVLALFRMLELTGGRIVIDGIDISSIPRQEVRSRLNAIPQDAYFLHGSIRMNLDPWEVRTDKELEDVLREVGLWDVVVAKGGLGELMEEAMLSHGQRQLFCLARAVLRPGKIVVLDEATSSVDKETDALMQRLIRTSFAQHTIIAVAHRLETILDFDRILVLDQGCVVECEAPMVLLGRKSVFSDLYASYERRREGEDVVEDERREVKEMEVME